MSFLRWDDKPFYEPRSADQSRLCYAKFNPNLAGSGLVGGPVDGAGTAVSAATIEVQANLLDFQVNGAAETVIGTYTANSGADNQIVFVDANIASIKNLVAAINGLAVGHPTGASALRRWRAGYGDFRPQFVIGAGDGLATAAANALLGFHDEGLGLLADSSGLASANLISIGCGVDKALRGGGQVFPDHFEDDVVVDTSGNVTPSRSAGRRAAAAPANPRTVVTITDIQVTALFATTKVVTVYDKDGTIVRSWNLGAATAVPRGELAADQPLVVGKPGTPLWVEISGTGAFTDGVCSVSGYSRVA